jgi:hypothetical protein
MQKSVSQEFIEEFIQNVSITDISSTVFKISDEIDRNSYLSLKVCSICNKNFGKIESKKYFCHFCYKAFCEKCSVFKLKHPETCKNERCCNFCYFDIIRKSVFTLVEDFAKVKMNAEITERVLEEEKQKTLNQEIQKLEEEIFREGEEQKKEIERIDKVIQKMENDVKAKIESAIKLRRKVANVSSGVKIND